MQPKRIVFLGASSVFGKNDPGGGGFAGRFKSWYESQDLKNSVFNLGIGGDITTGMSERFDEVIRRKPDLIILQLGLNDTKRTDSKDNPPTTAFEQFKNNVRELIKKCRKTDVTFLGVYPIDEKKTAPVQVKDVYYLMQDAKKYSEATKQICAEQNVPYLDIFNSWMNKDYLKFLSEDGLHCNPKGHEEIFNRLKHFFLERYQT